MSAPKFMIIIFVLIAAIQLYVPASMIIGQNEVITSGNMFHFKTAPMDPNDPFRGKYIRLRYQNNSVDVEDPGNWSPGEKVFAEIAEDEEGFATIEHLTKTPPAHTSNYIEVEIRSVDSNNRAIVNYPFDRLYLEESKAEPAEKRYLESISDSTRSTYSVVMVKDGKSVLEDVMIDGISIRELAGR